MTTWVLLRGLTREQGHWGDFPRELGGALAAAGGVAEIVALDLPGNGTLYQGTSPARITAMVEPLRAALRDGGWRPPYHLLAMSLGAMVAIAWAAQEPQELAGAVLVNTSARPLGPVHWRLRPSNYGVLLRLMLAHGAPRDREQAILRMTSRRTVGLEPIVDDWVRLRQARPVRRINALRQVLAAARFRLPQSAPRIALLLLASRRDALVDVRCSRRLAAAWACPLVEHPTAGHDLPLDDGPWVAARIRDWLAASAP
jgi:pimeloyl-ACP methyl ester carboxylesterase